MAASGKGKGIDIVFPPVGLMSHHRPSGGKQHCDLRRVAHNQS